MDADGELVCEIPIVVRHQFGAMAVINLVV